MNKKHRMLGLFALVLGGIWTVPVMYSLHSGMVFNPIVLPRESVVETMSIAPQGWRFFTKEVGKEGVRAYVNNGQGWEPAYESGLLRARFLWGANRTARFYPAEVSRFTSMIPEESWHACEKSAAECLSNIDEPIELMVSTPLKDICREFAVVRQEPVPWAWSRSDVVMPSKIVRIRVKC